MKGCLNKMILIKDIKKIRDTDYLDNHLSREYKLKTRADDNEIEDLRYYIKSARSGLDEKINDATKNIIRTLYVHMNYRVTYPLEFAQYYKIFINDLLDILYGNLFLEITHELK
jgi:DNA replicative helicase MCM subunit Mcm2 (Cdc46/Mcm family)